MNTWKHILLLSTLAACGGGDAEDTAAPVDSGDTGPAAPVCTTELSPGDDDQTTVQTALIEAEDGDLICFGAGTYTFATELSLSVDNVTLQGAGPEETIFDFSGQTVGANGLAILSDGVTVESLQVLDTAGDAIRATDVESISFLNVHVIWPDQYSVENGAYGLYPVGCTGVLIEDSLVVGARDAGIYVGQSSNILVRNNVAYDNVAGLEIENSTDSEVVGNHVYNNTGGIFVFNLPNLPVQDGKRAKVHDNIIENNNVENFAEPGTVVAGVPPGVGVFVIAADSNEVHDNVITGNKTAGVVMLAFTDLAFPGSVIENPEAYDAYSEHNYIHHNTFENNGYDPVGDIAARVEARPVPEILTDGCPFDRSQDLCVFENGDAGFIDIDICGLFLNQTDDISEVTCEGVSLDEIEPF